MRKGESVIGDSGGQFCLVLVVLFFSFPLAFPLSSFPLPPSSFSLSPLSFHPLHLRFPLPPAHYVHGEKF